MTSNPHTVTPSLAVSHPAVARLMHPSRNKVGVSAEALSAGSGLLVWWRHPECGHEWERRVQGQLKVRGADLCPFCAHVTLLPGFNDLGSTYPEVAALFAAAGVNVSEVMAGSPRRLPLKCEEGHTWEAPIRQVVRNYGADAGRACPFCDDRAVWPGLNDLVTMQPVLAERYHPTENVTPASEVHHRHARKVAWLCKSGHTFWTGVATMVDKALHTRTGGCPVCAGKTVIAGVNDLAFTHPEVAASWHPTRNSVSASEVYAASHSRTYWWVCAEGHEWETTPRHRTRRGQGCPFCAGNHPILNETDLATTHVELITEWDYTKNAKAPTEFTRGSEQKAWWVCPEKGHSYEAQINNRTRLGSGCPTCAMGRTSSKGEQEILAAIQGMYAGEILSNTRDIITPHEIDIYLPDLKIGVEFNGIYWHQEEKRGKAYHYEKWVAAQEAGVQLIQIWEDEWVGRPELVKRMLAHKLGQTQEASTYARNTTVTTITKAEAAVFLNAHHIQGETAATHYIALKTRDDETVAVMLLTQTDKTGETLDIVRYATSRNIPGGFTKLLTHSEHTHNPKTHITFSDHCHSDGNLYESNGFQNSQQLRPDYKYVVGNLRIHKANYRKSRFRRDSNLTYVEGLTETELAALNKLPRIWDAGKTKWTKQNLSYRVPGTASN